jgi:hypothetical protein
MELTILVTGRLVCLNVSVASVVTWLLFSFQVSELLPLLIRLP